MAISTKIFLVIALILFFNNIIAIDHPVFAASEMISTEEPGKRWAILVAGSNGYDNYRHQADVCHAYQILKRGGLEDENIIVFMYDDIALNPSNPRPGVIINNPDGPDVYQGVPKDYTGEHLNAPNFYAALLGNKSALTGGSGKVLQTGPRDHIFIYYTDHGAAGILGMPEGDYIYVNDLIHVLKKKHEAKSFKSMVIYVEACESGSMFDGQLPNNINIYATTASNSTESSWATYCPGQIPAPPSDFDTCLGDLYSVAWMEDSDKHDLSKETLNQQYYAVRKRTMISNLGYGSHVMLYGNKSMGSNFVDTYIGNGSENCHSHLDHATHPPAVSSAPNFFLSSSNGVTQRDATLFHYWYKYQEAPFGSIKEMEAKKELEDEILRRKHADYSINNIGELLFGPRSSQVLNDVRQQGQALVDDWDCYKTFVKIYEKHCNRMSSYGMKYARALANMCNAHVSINQMDQACLQTCTYTI